ncbi:unnamed protein product [Spirodela intermedia]|uniref:Uncharacterized protein n=1 Tax=Spirodela intermedia TaxID=51605 RepID=A0A7I8LGJ8_SPIIN|nr:unnamed protein product [Spirodela intermedia]
MGDVDLEHMIVASTSSFVVKLFLFILYK